MLPLFYRTGDKGVTDVAFFSCILGNIPDEVRNRHEHTSILKGLVNMVDAYFKRAHPVCIFSSYLVGSVVRKTVENTGTLLSTISRGRVTGQHGGGVTGR